MKSSLLLAAGALAAGLGGGYGYGDAPVLDSTLSRLRSPALGAGERVEPCRT
jgi:hypothetical protein